MSAAACYDVIVLGAGFGGTLVALALQKRGLRVALVDRGAHPKFAIGESSTPIANRQLAKLCEQYGLDEIAPLCQFGTWDAAYPQMGKGIKRGFSYFGHELGREFTPEPGHLSELLVAASSSTAVADTQWLRSDVDAFLCQQAAKGGVDAWLNAVANPLETHPRWRLQLDQSGETTNIEGQFLVDATGEAMVVSKWLGHELATLRLKTWSRGLFAHFKGLPPFEELAKGCGAVTGDYPFPADDAAVHQVTPEGWMWQLRFTNGVVSAGWALAKPGDQAFSPAAEFQQILDRYPTLRSQFASAEVIAPAVGLVRTGRLQRLASIVAGDNWALLPGTAGFIDPLYSTGIGHTLTGVWRLAEILSAGSQQARQERLPQYGAEVLAELHWIDELVSAAYATLGRFELFTLSTMLYFVAATGCERAGSGLSHAGFLGANDRLLMRAVLEAKRALLAGQATGQDAATIGAEMRDLLAEFNVAGLFDPRAHNMYEGTAAPDV